LGKTTVFFRFSCSRNSKALRNSSKGAAVFFPLIATVVPSGIIERASFAEAFKRIGFSFSWLDVTALRKKTGCWGLFESVPLPPETGQAYQIFLFAIGGSFRKMALVPVSFFRRGEKPVDIARHF